MKVRRRALHQLPSPARGESSGARNIRGDDTKIDVADGSLHCYRVADFRAAKRLAQWRIDADAPGIEVDLIMHALNRSARELSTVAVLFLDVNDFKLINDTLGHAAGDELLVAVAGRLLTCLRPGDTVARFGGDEFVMLLDGVRGNSGVMSVVERIRTELADSFTVRDQEVFITASIGVSLFPESARDARTLLKQADGAMYRSKQRGPGGTIMFSATTPDS